MADRTSTSSRADPADRPVRRSRDRARTEARLMAAARKLLQRDGVLAGLNLQEVAEESGVNRGQIYQLYGNRQGLLRAALADTLRRLVESWPDHWDQDFPDRPRQMLRLALADKVIVQVAALLALDGDEELVMFPAIDATRQAIERDKAKGVLAPDADGEALHVLTASTYLGYVLFREVFARDLDVSPTELDRRLAAAFDDVVERMAQ